MDQMPEDDVHLTWVNIAIGFSFVVLDAIISVSLGLQVGRSLLISATRCIIQLAIVANLLRKAFEAQSPWVVAGVALLLNFLGTLEIVVNRARRRYHNMFIQILIAMLGSTIPISVLGTRFAMSVEPVWKPERYIPITGMLCGNTISGVAISVDYILREIQENRDKMEMYLAFGSSRLEACISIAREGLRLALTSVINQMSVIGLISIPGMMTGALLGGSSVEQAGKLQMNIMFMVSASTALSSIAATVMTLRAVVDEDHRIRSDRIDIRPHAVWRARDRALSRIANGAGQTFRKLKAVFSKVPRARLTVDGTNSENERLLG